MRFFAALIGALALAPVSSLAVLAHDIPPEYIAAIKRSEGYSAQAYPDVRQWSIGWGTKARYPGEVIDEKEAELRFRAELSAAAEIVDGINPNLDIGTRAALISLTFNAGSAWVSAGLGDAIRRHELGPAQDLFLLYTKSNGRDLDGLIIRRRQEATWFATYRRECRMTDGQVGVMR